jgi:hypothetical protein
MAEDTVLEQEPAGDVDDRRMRAAAALRARRMSGSCALPAVKLLGKLANGRCGLGCTVHLIASTSS